MATQEQIKRLFEYRQGVLYWKVMSGRRIKIGDAAGSTDKQGYISTSIKGKAYKVHRLIFLLHHGYLPKVIDHIDGNTLNNNIENLREATTIQNGQNRKISINNASGIKGICWDKAVKKWKVYLKVPGKIRHFGYYYDIDYAKFVCEAMRHKYHGAFANHG